MSENSGAFYIPASDVISTDSFNIPSDQAGETPNGTPNDTQLSYSIDNRQKQHGKGYYVHIYNGWDISLKLLVNGSSYDDEEMRKSVVEQNNTELAPGESVAFEEDTMHSFVDLLVKDIVSVPTEGKLEVVFQDRYR